MNILVYTIAFLPSHEVIPTDIAFLSELDGTFTTNLEDNAFVGALVDIGITVLFGLEVPVRVGIGSIHIEVRHSCAFADLVDRDIKVFLGKGS